MLQILVSGKFIYIVLFHKQACHRALCREQRIINAGMSGRLNKSDRTGNRIEHWQKEMAQYCWQVLVCIDNLWKVSIFAFTTLSNIKYISQSYSGKVIWTDVQLKLISFNSNCSTFVSFCCLFAKYPNHLEKFGLKCKMNLAAGITEATATVWNDQTIQELFFSWEYIQRERVYKVGFNIMANIHQLQMVIVLMMKI